MLKKIIIVILILTSMKFYSLAFLPEVVLKLSEWIGIGILLAVMVIYGVYGEGIRSVKKQFTLPIVLIFISVLISMFGAYAYHDQTFFSTLYAQRAVYFYLIYFLLHQMKLEGRFIIRTILALALVYMAIYFAQYFLYPIELTKSKMFLDRGTLRIFIVGSGYLIISYYLWLYLTFKKTRFSYIVLLLLSIGIFVLLGTRQVLATILLITVLFILQSRVVKSKVLLFVLIGIALVPVYFMFQNIIMSMFEVTRAQAQNLDGGTRFEAAHFFIMHLMPTDLAYFIGNGAAGNSMYELRLDRYAEEYGYYLSDIGLIGEYFKFGAIYVIGVLIMFFKVFRTKIPDKLMFIKYNFFGTLLTLVTGGGAFGSSGENIIVLCFLFYLIDLYLKDSEAFSEYPV